MKYKFNLSENERIGDQYRGFLSTANILFWREDYITLFQLPEKESESPQLTVAPNLPIGKRAELFFMDTVSNSSHYTVQASQIQLITSGRTLGELDFIIYSSQTDELLHVELAYKLYLLIADNPSDPDSWVGPNKKDSLARKWKKLRDHQFPNIYTNPAALILKDLGLDKLPIKQKLCMPMQMFIPYGNDAQCMGRFASAFAGWWISFTDFKSKLWTGFNFFIPEKQDWFVNPDLCDIWLPLNEVQKDITKSLLDKKSPMLWMKTDNGIIGKLFVTFW